MITCGQYPPHADGRTNRTGGAKGKAPEYGGDEEEEEEKNGPAEAVPKAASWYTTRRARHGEGAR